MLTLHHLENSRSQRIIWLLEELGVGYQLKHYERDAKTNLAPDALKRVHPLGKSPMLQDGELVLPETGAIIEYLLVNYPQDGMRPEPGNPGWQHYTYWMHAAEGSIMALLVMKLLFTKITEPPVPFLIRPISKAISKQVNDSYILPSLQPHIEYIEQHLGEHQWFAGEQFTGADIMMSFPIEAAGSRMKLDGYPNIQAFLKRIHARPAYQAALEQGGPYDYA